MFTDELKEHLNNVIVESIKLIDVQLKELNELDTSNKDNLIKKYEEMQDIKLYLMNIYLCLLRCQFITKDHEYVKKYLEYDNMIKKLYYLYMYYKN